MKRYRKLTIATCLVVSVLLSCLLQLLCYRYDNKYTYPRPEAENGCIRLNTEWYDSSPFFYLVDGWSYYDGKFLSPEELDTHIPDDYLYIGRYGGLNRGDMARSAAGQATYYLVIETDETPRTFSLELSGVYDRWKLWVNGELYQSVGYSEENAHIVTGSIVTFKAADRIELVVSVESDGSGFYSGMVYPPAIGSQDRIAHVNTLRLLIHSSACVIAFSVCILCLALAIGNRTISPYGYLSFLCLCFCGTAAWPVYQYFGLTGSVLVLERVCYYGIFLSLILLQNHICRIERKISMVSVAVGILIPIAIAIRPMIPFPAAAVNLIWSQVLTVYKWFTAIYLIVCAGRALYKNTRYSVPLLAGNCAFAAALIMNRLLPMHEPVLLDGNVGIAGFLWICLLTGIIGYDAVSTYRERESLKHRQAISDIQLAAHAEHRRLQQEYVRATREQLHEGRSRLTLIRHYLDQGDYGQLTHYLEELLSYGTGLDSLQYTGNSLIDAILTLQLSRAEHLSVYAEQNFGSLCDPLPVEDEDITSLIINITDNALEALERISDSDDRWLHLRLEMNGGGLVIECENAIVPGEINAAKPDKEAHGFGLIIICSIVEKYNGNIQIERQEDSYFTSVYLPIDKN